MCSGGMKMRYVHLGWKLGGKAQMTGRILYWFRKDAFGFLPNMDPRKNTGD